ncbi:hypothetical protein ILUMI_24380 [Ignelater luminosus]|uniref:Zinc finger BED domain-containing protein 4 n=1 Tax=Ignelater luminosus TaxID=2038154 RepID=A0A8K0CDI7_IGNLU|nr:hypothetical protein ILUMI_24380 [Ignelater luminosus]
MEVLRKCSRGARDHQAWLEPRPMRANSGGLVESKARLGHESLQECVDKTKQWDNKSLKSLAVDNSITEIVALEDLPFIFVESVGFVRLMKHLCPSYNFKSRQYFTSFICDKLYGKKRLNQKPLKIIQECATRWNSTFYMLERILQVKESLCLYASTNNKIPQLTSKEWVIIEKLIGLLKPFEEVTKELSAADVSISSVIPLIATLQKIVNDLDSSDEHIGDTITVLKDEFIRKFSGLENEILFATATFIDPRYKVKFFKNTSTKEHVIQHILDLLGDGQTDVSSNSRCPNAKRVSHFEQPRLDHLLADLQDSFGYKTYSMGNNTFELKNLEMFKKGDIKAFESPLEQPLLDH